MGLCVRVLESAGSIQLDPSHSDTLIDGHRKRAEV